MLEARLVGSWRTRMVLVGFLSCGFGALMMHLTSRKYPRTLDAEGVTRRDGVRLAWRDLKDIRPVYVNHRLNHVRLLFTSGDVGVFFKAFANGAEVLDFVRAITRQPIPFSLRRPA